MTDSSAGRVAEDGTVELLGRGSVSINSGGEKIYPEEVEQAIKSHPDAYDAVVIGVPDERFGNRVAAIVQPGGSQRDQEVISACDEAGIAMIFTGERHFRN